MSVNMQEINSKLWIMGRIMEGAKVFSYQMMDKEDAMNYYKIGKELFLTYKHDLSPELVQKSNHGLEKQ